MKKRIVLVLFSFISCLAFGWSGNYSIRCYRCYELMKQHKGTCYGCPAWKDAWKQNEGYHYYKCPHGHKMRIPYGTDKSTRDISEIEYYSVKEHSWIIIGGK